MCQCEIPPDGISEVHLNCTGRRLAGAPAFRFSETGRRSWAGSAPPRLSALLSHTGQQTSFPIARAQVDDLLTERLKRPHKAAECLLSPGPRQCARLASCFSRRVAPCRGSSLYSRLCGWRAAEWASHLPGSWLCTLVASPRCHAVNF